MDGEISEALHNGTSFGLVSFGPMGTGKTTALWGSPHLGPEQALVPRACAEVGLGKFSSTGVGYYI